MSRLQKKCLIASGALHGLLMIILIVAPAFTYKPEPVVEQQMLNFVPDRLIDEAFQRAAAAAQPQPTPPPREEPVAQPREEPAPRPEPQPEPRPEPRKVEPKPESRRTDPKPPPPKVVEKQPETRPEPAPEPKPRPTPRIDLTLKTRDNTATIRQQQQAAADAARRRQEEFEKNRQAALQNFAKNTSKLTTPQVSATSLDIGTVGVSYGSYDAWVKKVYWEAWRPPSDIPAGDSMVTVKVVVRADGTVESSTVVEPSGVSKLDANIRSLLARVKTIGKPFPEGARESRRTYTIDFNLKAKLGAG